MKQAYFVTGTDTEVGKTFSACALLAKARMAGFSTAAVKPVASGAYLSAEGLRNEDGVALHQQCTIPLTYDQVNPVLFEPAIAPHIAAAQVNRHVGVADLLAYCNVVLKKDADLTLIEGAGGWRVPINETETLADLAVALHLPVILVVGMRLGCINHAVLTAEAIRRDGLTLAGWVANRITPTMSVYDENFSTLAKLLNAPCIAHITYRENKNFIDASSDVSWFQGE